MLFCERLPAGSDAAAGATGFVDIAAAHAALPPADQATVRRLRGRHSQYQLASEHPMVAMHPETGEQALYISPNTLLGVVGMEQQAGDALIDKLNGRMRCNHASRIGTGRPPTSSSGTTGRRCTARRR